MLHVFLAQEAMGMRQAVCIRNTSGKAIAGLHLEAERSQHQPGGEQGAPQREIQAFVGSGID